MPEAPSDNPARERFRSEHGVNFAVVASAGSGKTRAISERLAAIALSPRLSPTLEKTAVVTYTKKAAAEIAERARSELRRRLAGSPTGGAEPVIRLEKAFFGTIHSFCLLLARRHGSTLGVHLNPVVVDDDDVPTWQEFLAQDPMGFTAVSGAQLGGFLRHQSLDIIFPLAMRIAREEAASILGGTRPADIAPPLPVAALEALAGATARQGRDSANLSRNKDVISEWMRQFALSRDERLPIPTPDGNAGGVVDLYREIFAPLKAWLASVGGRLAAELSVRYRQWREDRGVQTFADQLETAHALLSDEALLEAARRDGWRVILDEAQDTDIKQFAVLIEITRPPGAVRGTWPGPGAAPRPGHFCMVGDPQQAIYSRRANIDRFREHVESFGKAQGSERLSFDVTFRAPKELAAFLNGTLAPAFGTSRAHNLAAPPAPGAPQRKLQVDYCPMVAFPSNPDGLVRRLAIEPAGGGRALDKSHLKLAAEARQVASLLKSGGPSAVGAVNLGDICILAPRKDWLLVIRDQFERVGIKTSLQLRQIRSAQNPAYAWLCGLLAVICDPENAFEWAGVLREVFAVSDAEIAEGFRRLPVRWEEPADYAPDTEGALRAVAPFIGRADDEGASLAAFAAELAQACGLHGRALAADPEGNVSAELERLLARASELGMAGAGPREWLADLLGGLDVGRSSGRRAPDAINILTCHSAKGLEWPVVIAMGLWRQVGTRPDRGLRLFDEPSGRISIVLDEAAIPAGVKERLANAKMREDCRLLYVTLTRAMRTLLLPWGTAPAEKGSFATLWGLDFASVPLLGPLPAAAAPAEEAPAPPDPAAAAAVPGGRVARPVLPRRILPHGLAAEPDLPRALLHESAAEPASGVRDAYDPIEYGTWWHVALQFAPWDGSGEDVEAHAASAVADAQARGFGERARQEWDRLLASPAWAEIRDPRWTRLAEAGIFAPLTEGAWIDGVMDLVLHDPQGRQLWIVDWKTNARRAGEGDPGLLGRLASMYDAQLKAYGTSAGPFFPGHKVRLWLYSTVAGSWTELAQ